MLLARGALGSTYYVDDDAPLGGGGTSWEDAFTFLSDALEVAQPGDEIRVACGLYQPDRDSAHPTGTGDRNTAFAVAAGLSLVGGFVGADDPELRDHVLFPSILSGDLNGDDGPGFSNRADNSRRVVSVTAGPGTTTLDGFSVRGGHADSGDFSGAGLAVGAAPALVRDCTFTDNFAFFDGGALLAAGGIRLEACAFIQNYSDDRGGALYLTTGDSVLEDCTFEHNEATGAGGGGVYLESGTLRADRCLFQMNRATSNDGGAILARGNLSATGSSWSDNTADFWGGAIYAEAVELGLAGCHFADNAARNGGAIRQASGGSLVADASVFEGNRAAFEGGALDTNSATLLRECDFRSNRALGSGNGGAAIFHELTAIDALDCVFSQNAATPDGGALLLLGTSRLVNCTLAANSATRDAGAIANFAGTLDLAGCLVIENDAGRDGGAVKNLGDRLTIVNATVVGNHADRFAGGILNGPSDFPPRGAPQTHLHNSLLWQNTDAAGGAQDSQVLPSAGLLTVDHSTIQGWTGGLGGENNDGFDPLLRDRDGADDDPLFWADNDYALLCVSPCIDAGRNDSLPTDWLDADANGATAEPLPIDRRGQARRLDVASAVDTGVGAVPLVDRGALERVACLGDVNGDELVDGADLAELIAAFGASAGSSDWEPAADFDANGRVDASDLALLLSAYGRGCIES